MDIERRKDKTRFAFRLPAAGCCLVLLCLCAACEQEDTAAVAPVPEAKCPLTVSGLYTTKADAAMPDAAMLSGVTRAATAEALPTSAVIGFYLKAAAGSGVDDLVNKQSKYDATNNWWMPVGDTIWLSKATHQAAVYYPYKATYATKLLPLTRSLRTDDTADLWSTRFKANGKTENTGLTLTQIYSRLTLTFVKHADADYTGPAKLTALTLSGPQLYASGTFDVLDSVYAYTGSPTPFTRTGDSQTVTGTDPTATGAVRYDLLMLPHATLTGDITVTATVDGKPMKITLPKEKLSGKLAPGKQYKATIRLKPKALMVSSISITDWETAATLNDDARLDEETPTTKATISQLSQTNKADETE